MLAHPLLGEDGSTDIKVRCTTPLLFMLSQSYIPLCTYSIDDLLDEASN